MATDFGDGCCGDMHAQVVALDAQEMLQVAIRRATAQAARLRKIVQIAQVVQIAQDVQAVGIRVRAIVSPLVHNPTGGEE